MFLLSSASIASASDCSILVLGDSLSAGYNMRLEQSWPSLLQQRLDDEGRPCRVINSSITGDTTQGGWSRLPRLLTRHHPDIVVIELGGNDGLRGLSIDVTRGNLESMILASKEAGAQIVLAGIMLPPNYGAAYTERFQAIYPELAAQHDIALHPFILEGVALDPELMQSDGIHPNALAQPMLLENLWPLLSAALE